MEDYRDLKGIYSKLVSVEMIEAVGWQYFDTFFEKCASLLAPDGRMCLQAIVIDDRAYEPDKAAKSFANTVIFPGGCLPSHEVIARCISKRTDMRILDLEDLSPHYAETVRRWRERFAANAAAGRGAGLRPALPPHVGPLPGLVRGWLRGAADRRGADPHAPSRPTGSGSKPARARPAEAALPR